MWHRSVAPPLPFMYPTFEATPAPYILTSTTVRGLEDMISSPLGQHILSHELPCGFVILSFSMYDGSFDLYDHMLHFNQAMIHNVGNDRLLCEVFSASLKGPALAWFHKLPWRSINSFSELWVALVSHTRAQFDGREISVLCKPSLSGRTNTSAISLKDLEDPSNLLIHTVWMRSFRISEGALGRPPHSSTRCLWIRLRQWKNCTDGRIHIQCWRTISGQPLKP